MAFVELLNDEKWQILLFIRVVATIVDEIVEIDFIDEKVFVHRQFASDDDDEPELDECDEVDCYVLDEIDDADAEDIDDDEVDELGLIALDAID